MLFALANLPYWIFLGSGVVLFLFVIVSGGGDDDLDADMDVDADVDADFDLDADVDAGGSQLLDLDADGDADSSGDFGTAQVLGWFGIGKAPLILLIALDLCLWGLAGWTLNVIVAGLMGEIGGAIAEFGVLILSLIIALNVGGLIARPIGRIFASFTEDSSCDRLIGCLGTVTSASIPFSDSGKIGQIDVYDAAHNFVTVSAVLPTWAQISLRRGAKVFVIERHTKGYVVIAQNSIDQQNWLNGTFEQPQDSLTSQQPQDSNLLNP